MPSWPTSGATTSERVRAVARRKFADVLEELREAGEGGSAMDAIGLLQEAEDLLRDLESRAGRDQASE